MASDAGVRCWVVRDTGLVPAPGPFRRLAGAVRHHRGRGAAWPGEVELAVTGDDLTVSGVGSWPVSDASVQVLRPGPPVTFVLRLPSGTHLLAAPAGPATDALLAHLTTGSSE